MNRIFEILAQSERANQLAMESEGRVNYPILGIVTNNQDPEGRRRVKVNTALNPGLDTPWLTRICPNPFRDAPVPTLGQTVLIFYIDGLETKGCYLPLQNDTNPSYETSDPLQDLKEEIPGARDVSIQTDDSLVVGSNMEHRIEGNIDISCGTTVTIRNDSGATITLGNGGQVIITDSVGRQLRLGGSISSDNIWDLNGFPLKLQNVPSATINGSEIATVGAVDDNGDALVTRGW